MVLANEIASKGQGIRVGTEGCYWKRPLEGPFPLKDKSMATAAATAVSLAVVLDPYEQSAVRALL